MDFKDFNPAPPTVMCLDMNSCFATIEQQANPLLRGKPVAVAAYTTPGGCILAASVEAKRWGIKTGMRVGEGKRLYPALIVLPPDPSKYRFVNRKLLALLNEYTANIEVKSIDEMILSFSGSPILAKYSKCLVTIEAMKAAAQEIKKRIKQEIGEWLTVSVGIAPNRYLAKIASTLHKPDGLEVISQDNIERVLAGLKLEQLCGIKAGYGRRLRVRGITSPLDMYRAAPHALKHAFGSKIGFDWWLWLHGWESSLFDQGETKSIGHSYALGKPYLPHDLRLQQILCQLVEKMGRRLRNNGFKTQGIHISCLFTDHTSWNHGEKLPGTLFTNNSLYKEALRVLKKAPNKPIRLMAVACFYLSDGSKEQLGLFEPFDKKRGLTQALDTIADRWGEFTVFPGRMLGMEQKVLDRIAFGKQNLTTEPFLAA
ncbi:MAG: DNA polymerase Y family protein [Patescibacteria group bacterium]